jgi:hypothetical protein
MDGIRVFVPAGSTSLTLEEVRGKWRHAVIQPDLDMRLSKDVEYEINRDFAPFGLRLSRDDDGGRQFVNDGRVELEAMSVAPPDRDSSGGHDLPTGGAPVERRLHAVADGDPEWRDEE